MYQAPNMTLWKGRKNPGTLMFHEIVQSLDLTNDAWTPSSEINFAFIGFACDEGVRRNMGRVGAQFAPDEIRKILSLMAVHHDTARVGIVDAGNVLCGSQNLEASAALLTGKIQTLLELGFLPIVLGGGHETAFPHFNAIINSRKNGESVGILNFDAHFDMRTYENGHHSGSSFRQIFDSASSDNYSFNYLPVGIRPESNTSTLFEVMRKAEQGYILLEEVQDEPGEVLHKIKSFVESLDSLYVTIDMDCFPAAFAPGVSAAAPDGLMPAFVKKALTNVIETGKLASIDLVETNPNFDDGRTIKLVAHLIFHIISRVIQNKLH